MSKIKYHAGEWKDKTEQTSRVFSHQFAKCNISEHTSSTEGSVHKEGSYLLLNSRA